MTLTILNNKYRKVSSLTNTLVMQKKKYLQKTSISWLHTKTELQWGREREVRTPSPEWRHCLKITGLRLAATPSTWLNRKGLFYPPSLDNPAHTGSTKLQCTQGTIWQSNVSTGAPDTKAKQTELFQSESNSDSVPNVCMFLYQWGKTKGLLVCLWVNVSSQKQM